MNIVRGEQKSGGIQNKFVGKSAFLKHHKQFPVPSSLLIRIRFPGRDGAAGGGDAAVA